jgi:glyoxylase-like metal-dependent hydrolase (beta-lactamase superfamily II)
MVICLRRLPARGMRDRKHQRPAAFDLAGRPLLPNTTTRRGVLQSRPAGRYRSRVLREERHGDVTRLVFESWPSRSMGFTVSAYFVRGALVDTAFPDVRADLGAWLEKRRPDGVIVTHSHEDHAGNVELAARRGVPMWIAAETLERVRRPSRIGWYRRWCWGTPAPLASEPAAFAHPSLEVIHTPGHSPEHHVVWDAERETVFGADLFLGVKVKVSHPWPREDVRAQVVALRRVIALKPKRYFDAHRGLVPDATSQLSAKADWTEETVGRIDALIAEGADDRAIVRDVFGGEPAMSYVTLFDYSRRNFVASVRRTLEEKR